MLLTALAGGHRADRPDRHRLDHLQRAVQPGPPVRLARPHQRRPGRLEHRHHRRRSTPPATSASTTLPAHARPLRAGRRVPGRRRCKLWDSWDDDAASATRRPASGATTRKVHPIGHVGRHFRVARRRSTCRARRRATRCSCRPARRRTARTSPPGTPRRCSPRSRRSRTRRRSTPTSSGGPPRRGRDPDDVKILPGIVPGHRRAPRPRRARLERRARRLIRPEYAARAAGQDAPRATPTTCALDAQLPADLPRRGRDRGRQEPLHADREPGPPRAAHRAPADRPARRRPRPPHLRRHARAGRRRDPGLVRRRAPPTASTSCRPCCRRASRRSSTTWCRSCASAGCSVASTTGTHPARALRPAAT